jgi:hypothetical protein
LVDDSVGRSRRRDQSLAALVGIALFASYVAVSRARIKSYDGSIMVQLATRLLTKHTLTIDPAHDSLHLQSPHVSYGFGTSLLVLPFDAVQRLVHVGGASILTLANPLVLAVCGVVLFFVGRRLGWDRWVCVGTALGFGLLTTALWQSTEAFSEPGVALACLLVVAAVLVWGEDFRRGSLLMGVGIATAILFRPDSLLLVAPFAVAALFVVPHDLVFSRGALVRLVVPIALVGGFQLWYDFYRYGSVFSTGYSQQARGRGFDTPIFRGLDLLLRSPGRGFFWTSPILLIALPGIVTLYRRSHVITIAIVIAVIGRFLYFAAWWIPGGGVAWGPRLLFPVTALLAIPAGDFVQRVSEWPSVRSRRLVWTMIGVLAVLSAFVSVLSIAIGYEQYWNRWTRVPVAEASSRQHAYYWSLAHNPIAGNVHLLRSGQLLAPIHFRNGIDILGFLSLAISISAIIVAFRRARDPGPPAREIKAITGDVEAAASRT